MYDLLRNDEQRRLRDEARELVRRVPREMDCLARHRVVDRCVRTGGLDVAARLHRRAGVRGAHIAKRRVQMGRRAPGGGAASTGSAASPGGSREKQAIVNILAAIGHGEAYAWLVSAELLGQVRSTGARAALTMQVLEEAKHFVVLRELLQAFGTPIPRQSAWEYLLLEQVYKSKGLKKLFGMNVLVEGIALGLFGLMGDMPGLELLRLFHLDESRHTGLPVNYLSEFPLSPWERRNPLARLRLLRLVLPALALIPLLEEDMAELGIDAFEFGGSVVRKISVLAERAGFETVPRDALLRRLDDLFNLYCRRTRPGWTDRRFTDAETTRGGSQLAVEREIFGAASA